MAKFEFDYFNAFLQLEEYSVQAAASLKDTIDNFDVETLSDRMSAIHVIEHTADIEKHKLMQRLIKEFLPPIEREDIIELTNAIDDLTDSIEDVVIRLYMYNAQSVPDEAKKFCNVIMECVHALKNLLGEFRNFKRSKNMGDLIIEVNRLEEVGDQIYANAIHDLFVSKQDPITTVAWMEIYERLEKCCDKCVDVSTIVSSTAMKNS